jgi:hypothetical protein
MRIVDNLINTWTTVHSQAKAVIVAGAVATTSLVLGGCYSEGGLGWSEDQFVYVSHEYQPWSVTLIDLRTGQEIWAIDVPVGQQLVVHFLPNDGAKQGESGFTPDSMEWALMKKGTEFGPLPNKIAVPGKESRKLVGNLRATPELPSDMRPGDAKPPITEVTTEPMTPP